MAVDTARAARRTDEFFQTMTQTPGDIIAGKYHTERQAFVQGGQASFPFTSSQDKVLNPNVGTSGMTPGPGSYVSPDAHALNMVEPRFGEASTMSGTTLRSTSTRLGPTAPGSTIFTTSTIVQNPGPGTYEHSPVWWTSEKDLVGGVAPVVQANGGGKTAPSMPAGRLLPGQPSAQDDIARLQAKFKGEPQDSAGPGEYDLPTGVAFDQVDRLGPNFGGGCENTRNLWEPSVSIDSKFTERELPGPGQYNADIAEEGLTKNTANAGAKAYQSDANFTSKTELAHQKQAKVDKPGPGAYDVVGELERSFKKSHDRGLQLDVQFNSSSERVGWSRDIYQPYKDAYNVRHVPGPGQYPEQESIFLSPRRKAEEQEKLTNGGKKKTHGVHHPAMVMALQEQQATVQSFHSTDSRPCMKPMLQATPAPSTYEIARARGFSMGSDLREKGKVGRRGIFGTCANRFHGSPLNNVKTETAGAPWNTPGNSVDEAVMTRSPLQSRTSRFKATAGPREVEATALAVKETPGPFSYDTMSEVSYRSPFRQPKQEHVSFGSSDKRFTGAAANFGKAKGIDTDAGNYDPTFGQVRSRTTGAAELKSQRRTPYVGCSTEMVGPGSYGEPREEPTLMKKSFNVSRQAFTKGLPMSARLSSTGRR